MVKQNVPNVIQCATSCASLWREGQNWLSGKAGRNVFSFRELHRNAVGESIGTQAENAEKAGGSCGNVGRQAKKLRRFAKFLGNSSYLCRAIYIITEVSEVKVEVKVEVNSLRSWKL